MVIFKYPIPVDDEFEINLPENAEILSVQVQDEQVVLWAMIHNRNDKTVIREFGVIATGQSFGKLGYEHRYIGTFQLQDGSFVGHLFEFRPRT